MDVERSTTVPVELHPLLSELRAELNRLNTLNCVLHQYQGDFNADKVLAQKTTDGATAMYLEHLRGKVMPLFTALGRKLVEGGHIENGVDLTEGEYASAARRWYSKVYETGVLW